MAQRANAAGSRRQPANPTIRAIAASKVKLSPVALRLQKTKDEDRAKSKAANNAPSRPSSSRSP